MDKERLGKKKVSLIPRQWWNPWAWKMARKQEAVLNWYLDHPDYAKEKGKRLEL